MKRIRRAFARLRGVPAEPPPVPPTPRSTAHARPRRTLCPWPEPFDGDATALVRPYVLLSAVRNGEAL